MVIAAAALLPAEHLVRFTQLHKATVQGWVPGVPVRVQLGWGRTSLISCPFPRSFTGTISIISTHKGSNHSQRSCLGSDPHSQALGPGTPPEGQSVKRHSCSIPCSSPPPLPSAWFSLYALARALLSQEQTSLENQAQPIRQDLWLSSCPARPLPLGRTPPYAC